VAGLNKFQPAMLNGYAQVVNAVIWGVVYTYARSRTESIYPPMLLHAAMNLMVILF
jgi:membrane protease YdiL (CAAX protease family)